MMNYNVSGSRSASGGSSYQYLRAYTETGVNIADWIPRSRQDYYSQGGRSTFTQGDTYAQHAVPSVRSTFQAGQISPAGSLFSVGTLRGAQLFPNRRCARRWPRASTSAASPRARAGSRCGSWAG